MASPYNDPAFLAAMMRDTGLPMPSSFPSALEVKAQARELSSDIFTLWNTLNSIVTRKEEVIRKRWFKKNKNARASVLLRAWPDMPTRHRPDFWALSHPESSQHAERYLKSFKYPYINLEDLTMQRPLLLLLNARARDPPSTFPHADVHKWHVGRIKGVVRPLFLNEHTMYLAGQHTNATYGKLISWDDDDEAFELMHTGLQFQPGEGVLALEAERTILDFLIKCCQGIFSDIPLTELMSLQLPEQREPPDLVSQENAYAQLSLLTADAPYRAPAHQDFEALKTLITARRAAAEDHISDLREDPAYLVWVATTLADHTLQRIPDTAGKLHPNSDDNTFWQFVLTTLTMNAYGAFLVWDQLFDRISAVVDAFRGVVLNPQSQLPAKLRDAFLELRYALDLCAKGKIADLKSLIPGSPEVRRYYVREPNRYGSMQSRIKTKSTPAKGSMLELMMFLWDENQRFLYGMTNLVDELQRLVDDNKEERSKFSGLVIATFSDLALISHTTHQVETFFPWSASFEELAVDFKSTKHQQELKDFGILSKRTNMPNLVQSVMPFARNLAYPINKAANKSNINTMREAEANLDRFWSIIDQHFGNDGKALHNLLSRHGAEPREIKRTPPFSEAIETANEVQGNRTDTEKPHDLEENIQSQRLSSLALDDYPQRPPVEPLKQKIKTRGIAGALRQDRQPDLHQIQRSSQSESNPEPIFQVSKRALKVFKSLFFTPSTTTSQATSGEIPWADFLHAMASTGCSIEKLHGSVWQFVPKDKDLFGWHNIHFHEPHPSNKIPFTLARRMGRRLNRNYGWSEKSFVAAGGEGV